MAHNLAYRNGRHMMFCRGDRKAAWHELGQRIDGAATWEQVVQLADLGWGVEKLQLSGPFGPVESWGIFRDDDHAFLGPVGDRYQPLQNVEALSFVDALLAAAGGAHYESAGALGRGEKVWALARVPSSDFQVAGDAHETYLLVATSHDASMSTTVRLTTTRVVCQNTLNIALNGAESEVLKVKHTSGAHDRLQQAVRAMEGYAHNAQGLRDKLSFLASRRLARENVQNILSKLFPAAFVPQDKGKPSSKSENIVRDLLSCYQDRVNSDSAPQSGYALLNAVTDYVDHSRSVKGADYHGGIERARATAAMFGTGDGLKTKALQVIMEEAEKVIPQPCDGRGAGLLDSVISATNN